MWLQIDLSLPFIFPLFFIIILIIVLIAINYSIKKSNKLKKAMEKQAIKRNGEIISRFGSLGYPILKFNYEDNEFIVYSIHGGKNRPPYTYVKVDLAIPINQHMRLYKEGFASRIGKKIGTQDIEIGLDSFDNDIMIKGSDEYFVRSILTYKIQEHVLKIIRTHRAAINLYQDKLVIYVPMVIYDDFVYDELINTAIAIVDQIKEKRHY